MALEQANYAAEAACLAGLLPDMLARVRAELVARGQVMPET